MILLLILYVCFPVDTVLKKVFLCSFTLNSGIAAATMFNPDMKNQLSDIQLKVAFDGDAVLFSDESEIIVKKHGLDTFFEHEKEFENKPLAKVNIQAVVPI